jgi:hypothetical protein
MDVRLGPARGFHQGDDSIEVWSALDALVLKATAPVVTVHWLPGFSHHCHYPEGQVVVAANIAAQRE